jgi:hypothetical protein
MKRLKRFFCRKPETKTAKLLLATRTTNNANLIGGYYHQELTARQFLSVFLQYGSELFSLDLELGSWEVKANDTSVGELALEDQLTEITVSNDQNPLLLPGYCPYLPGERIFTRSVEGR